MAQQKKKKVHPPRKRKKLDQSRDLTEMESLLKKRINPASNGKASKTKRTYHSDASSFGYAQDALSASLGLPPLKMVLVHAENDRANAAAEPVIRAARIRGLIQQETVMKIIEHLKGQ